MVMPAVSAVPQSTVAAQPGEGTPVIPFRKATLERMDILNPETGTLSANIQRFDRTIEGSGFLSGILLRLVATAAGNTANVAYHEDAPWSALENVTLKDVAGEVVNLTGYDLYIANLANAMYGDRFWDASSDTNIYRLVSGAGSTGGSFTLTARIPVITDRRRLLGLLGNQDRAQRYQLRTDINTLASIYTTAPTNAPPYVLEKYYENYGVPLPVGPGGVQQQVVPSHFGTLHFTTATVSESTPQGGSIIDHYLRRIGHTVRWIALIFRANGSRATAHANAPTNIRVKFGDVIQFNESYAIRRAIMQERYGFDFPNGVLVYDALHDFGARAGYEMGDDYWHTQNLVNAMFQVTYPTGFGATNNSLRIVTDDLVFVQPAG